MTCGTVMPGNLLGESSSVKEVLEMDIRDLFSDVNPQPSTALIVVQGSSCQLEVTCKPVCIAERR
jgi:hypothetical protein